MHVECGAWFPPRVSTLPPIPGLLHHESFSFALAKLLPETGEFHATYGQPCLTCIDLFLSFFLTSYSLES